MSWSVNASGTTDETIATLNEHASKIHFEDCKAEYEAALPHLTGLVEQTRGTTPIKVTVIASGHNAKDHQANTKTYGMLNVNIQTEHVTA